MLYRENSGKRDMEVGSGSGQLAKDLKEAQRSHMRIRGERVPYGGKSTVLRAWGSSVSGMFKLLVRRTVS